MVTFMPLALHTETLEQYFHMDMHAQQTSVSMQIETNHITQAE